MEEELLTTYGIDFKKGLQNCMENLPFYKKILTMFAEDQCFAQAKVAYADKNQEELFSRMHELKGTSGNAALMALYNSVVPLVDVLRRGETDWPEIERLFTVVETEYHRTCEGIAFIIAQH